MSIVQSSLTNMFTFVEWKLLAYGSAWTIPVQDVKVPTFIVSGSKAYVISIPIKAINAS